MNSRTYNEELSLKTRIRESALKSNKEINLIGSDQVESLAMLLADTSQDYHKRPQFVLTTTTNEAIKLKESIGFFSKQLEVFILPEFDIDIYSGLYPKTSNVAARINWIFNSFNAKPGQIFIASLKAICQKTIPVDTFIGHCSHFSVGDEFTEQTIKELSTLGYLPTPTVEDVSTFSSRGGIFDVFSPAHTHPIRIELFGDIIDSIRHFDPETQRTLKEVKSFDLVPAREVLLTSELRQNAAISFKRSINKRSLSSGESDHITHSLSRGQIFSGVDLLLTDFYDHPDSPLAYFTSPLTIWKLDPIQITKLADEFSAELKDSYNSSDELLIQLDPSKHFDNLLDLKFPDDSFNIELSKISFAEDQDIEYLNWNTRELTEFKKSLSAMKVGTDEFVSYFNSKISSWREKNFNIFISSSSDTLNERLKLLIDKIEYKHEVTDDHIAWNELCDLQTNDHKLIHIIPRNLDNSFYIEQESVLFLKAEDILQKKGRRKAKKNAAQSFKEKVQALSFAELNPEDLIVHQLHGVGIYKGLTIMPINGIDAEFLELEYKNNDKLYLPIYRIGQIQKYSTPSSSRNLDKLGGTSWEKAKVKVKSKLRDIAAELVELYAKRTQARRPAFSSPDEDFINFESAFPFEETDDQLTAINDVISDMVSDKPMDRLICGDVGFGKTEVAMRAAFKCVQDRKQVAVVAPTTILTLQHFENFKKRFKDWPVDIRCMNRFISKADVKKNIADLKAGKVDIIIGTHRLFSKDVEFSDLSLLIIDEEQKFGVRHKEKIRKYKADVDTLTLSATPIPRTLNMSFLGIRDLSLINTPPVDRLPTRTLICRRENSTIRKAILSEVQRGGQIFYLHNKVQSIENEAFELRQILPEIKIGIGHGQMDEAQLEKVILQFYNHEIDLLLCTTIIESGIDIPNANTMFINNAQQLGLSQLYQLRGRVGRSQRRAYCYLLVPPFRTIDKIAQERLRALQENTALGSGIKIAQYDLELRGAGNLLGESQAGHVQTVGYEMYMELLNEAVLEQKGEEPKQNDIEPEINLRIPALIPSQYIADIRVRLSYYKILSQVQGPDDLDQIEEDLKDQFGKPPEQVLNLMGIMLIRKKCKDLGIKELSGGAAGISLRFTDHTPLKINKVLELTTQQSQKYRLAPDSRLVIRMKELSWPRVLDEVSYLEKLT